MEFLRFGFRLTETDQVRALPHRVRADGVPAIDSDDEPEDGHPPDHALPRV